jgi:hypothetical protein
LAIPQGWRGGDLPLEEENVIYATEKLGKKQKKNLIF